MTKTDWTSEEVRAMARVCLSDTADMLTAYANRIEQDERAVPVAWLVVDAKGKRFTIYNPRLAEAIKQVAEQSGSTLKVAAVCEMPLEGWYCTRGAGHEGPCAAWPNHPPAQAAKASNGCTLGCSDYCKAKAHGCASECQALIAESVAQADAEGKQQWDELASILGADGDDVDAVFMAARKAVAKPDAGAVSDEDVAVARRAYSGRETIDSSDHLCNSWMRAALESYASRHARQVPDGCIPIHRTLLDKLARDMDAIDMPKIGAALRRWVSNYDASQSVRPPASDNKSLLTGTTDDGLPYGLHGTAESVNALSDYLARLEAKPDAVVVSDCVHSWRDYGKVNHARCDKCHAKAVIGYEENPYTSRHARQVPDGPENVHADLPPGYRMAERDGDYWPIFNDWYATYDAFPTRELAALAAWEQAYEKLDGRMDGIRRLAAAPPAPEKG